jgi:hypothetical protein
MSSLALSKQCSFYPSKGHTSHQEAIDLSAWLQGDFNGFLYAHPIGKEWKTVSKEHRAAMERYFIGKPVIECLERYRADISKRGKTPFNSLVKNHLPAITPSAVLSYRNGQSLSAHTGLLAGDIDLKENPFTAVSLKAFMSKIENVAYAGLSASGQGVWFIVPITCPEKHTEHFAALKAQLAGFNINLDPAPANVASLRFFSFDEAAYFNPAAIPYACTQAPKTRPQRDEYQRHYVRASGDNAGKVEAILSQIEAGRTDITEKYPTWFSIGCALANEFGETGRGYFHQASQYHQAYNTNETDKQFSSCLRMKSNRYTLGTFFEVAKRYGFEYKSHLPKPLQKLRYEPRQSPTIDLPILVGQSEILLNSAGYPATWD